MLLSHVHHQFSLPSYCNLYVWNWFTLSASIPFLINHLSVDLYSGQRVNPSSIFCFNIVSMAEIGLWQWLSRHPSASGRTMQMNCQETELTKSCIFLSALPLSALLYQFSNFLWKNSPPADRHNGEGCGDSWCWGCEDYSNQHAYVGMWTPCKTHFFI